MPSSFGGVDLFGSGPHRFAQGRQGELVIPNTAGGTPTGGSSPIAPLELDVIVTGRLVASDEAGLWALRGVILGMLQHPPIQADLVDLHGHVWPGMAFIRYEEEDRTDRGRAVSVGYTATFRRFWTGQDV